MWTLVTDVTRHYERQRVPVKSASHLDTGPGGAGLLEPNWKRWLVGGACRQNFRRAHRYGYVETFDKLETGGAPATLVGARVLVVKLTTPMGAAGIEPATSRV